MTRAVDQSKDQTYFLNDIDKKVLSRCLFPIGDIKKSEVREIAKKRDLITHNKKDSTGICFIGERPFPEFLSNYLPLIKGKILDDNNNVIGEHNGLYFYTIGQRQGLGIGGVKGSQELPWYVAKKNIEENTLIVVQDNEHPLLFESKLEVSGINWLINQKPDLNELTAKIRYRQKDQNCSLLKTKKNWQVNFKVPQRAITSGQ